MSSFIFTIFADQYPIRAGARYAVRERGGGGFQLFGAGYRCSSYLLGVKRQRFGTTWGARDESLTFAYGAVPFRASSVSYKQNIKSLSKVWKVLIRFSYL